MNDAIIEKLFLQYQQKGFLTNDEILAELVFSNVSIIQTERICSELLAKGVLISDSAPSKKRESNLNSDYDKAHIDYNALYEKIIRKEPNLKFLVNYIRKIQPPQLHEVEKLYPQIQEENIFARNRLFEMNMRMALKLAYQKAKQFQLSLEDTVQNAMIGLLESIENFNLAKHEKFQGYSTFWILNSINRNKNINETLITIPAHFLELHEKIYKYLLIKHIDFFDGEISSDKLISEISTFFNISKDSTEHHLILLYPMLDERAFEELVFDDVSDKICNKIFAEQINAVLDKLKSKERQVLKLRFGLYRKNDFDFDNICNFINYKIYDREGKYGYSQTLTLEQIAKLYGLTRERIRQIELKALKKLKQKLLSLDVVES